MHTNAPAIPWRLQRPPGRVTSPSATGLAIKIDARCPNNNATSQKQAKMTEGKRERDPNMLQEALGNPRAVTTPACDPKLEVVQKARGVASRRHHELRVELGHPAETHESGCSLATFQRHQSG
jgi:hypothetical protein